MSGLASLTTGEPSLVWFTEKLLPDEQMFCAVITVPIVVMGPHAESTSSNKHPWN